MSNHEILYEQPNSRDSLLMALACVDEQVTALWARLTATEFFTFPTSEGWSPAANVEHLTRTVKPIAMALRFPRIVVRLMFGAPRRPSRSFVELRDTYREALRRGAGAGKFASRRHAPPANVVGARETMLRKWSLVVPNLCAALRRWDDAALDRYQLPHPILGKLTIREMLYFDLFHLCHHAEIVAARHPYKRMHS